MVVKSKSNNTNKTMINTRPFLKWAGNKYRIIDRVRAALPEGKCLIEPFAGSGAVFLNTNYERYIINDNNPDLIHLYNILKKDGPVFIKKCRYYFSSRFNSEEQYYKLRKKFNESSDTYKRAILFVYLNRHGYNGLCRYNQQGGFNVPFGRYKQPYFPEQEMQNFHRQSQKARFTNECFLTAMKKARRGDVVYCDPPYVPLTKTANFTSYSAGGFSETEQLALAEQAEKLAARGVTVVISNHDTPFTQHVYRNAECTTFPVRRTISCNAKRRGHAGEVLALFN